MGHVWGAVAAVIVVVSWIAAVGAGIYVEYLGWHAVIADDNIVGGLAIATLAAPFAFMTVQTIVGLAAALFALLAERSEPQETSELVETDW